MKSGISSHLHDKRYFYLLAATMLQVFLSSFFPDRGNNLINEITFSLFMIANLNFIWYRRKVVIFTMFIFAFVSITLMWLPAETNIGQRSAPFEHLIVILFLSVIVYNIIRQIVLSRDVSVNMILGVITIYILFGMVAGEVNQMIHYFDTKAFAGNLNPGEVADLRYYSFVTMTTLGYGDIAPVSKIARASAVFFSLVGQIYLAVVIALIVGKYVSHSGRMTNTDK